MWKRGRILKSARALRPTSEVVSTQLEYNFNYLHSSLQIPNSFCEPSSSVACTMLRIHILQIVDASMHYANSVTIDQSSCRLSGVRKTTNQVYLRREFLFNFLNPHEKLTLLVLYSPFTFPGMKMIDMEWMRDQFSCTKLGSSDHTDNLGRPGSGNVGPGRLDGPLLMSSTCRSKIYRDFNEWCDCEKTARKFWKIGNIISCRLL